MPRRPHDRERPAPPAPPAPTIRLDSPRLYWPAFFAILILAVTLRLVGISSQSLWLDELWTEEVSTGRGSPHLTLPHNQILEHPPAMTRLDAQPPPSPLRVWSGMDLVTHPPLYFAILGFWRQVFGGSDISARMLSVLCSALAMLALFDTARRLNGPVVALGACLLLAIAQPMVEYGQSVRNYAFVVATALAAANLLVRIEQDGNASWPRLMLLALALLASALTHYFAAGTLLAMFIYAALRLRGAVRLKTLSAFLAAGLAFCALWGPFMLRQSPKFSTQDPTTVFLSDTEPGHFTRTLVDLAALPARWLSPISKDLAAYFSIAGLFWLAPLWFICRARRSGLFVWCLWTVCTVGPLLLLDLTRSTTHLAVVRYSLLAAPAAFAIICGTLAPTAAVAGANARLLPPAIAVMLALLGLTILKPDPNVPWRALASHVDQRAGPTDLLVFAAPLNDEGLNYMLMAFTHYTAHPDRPAALLDLRSPSPNNPGPRDLLAKLLASKSATPGRRTWLITGSPDIPPDLPAFSATGQRMDGAPFAVYELNPQ